MAETMSDEGFLLALLNTTPVVDGAPTDDLEDGDRARNWLASVGGHGTDPELRYVREVRAMLQAIVRGERPPEVLAPTLRGAVVQPAISGGEITWALSVAPERELAIRAVLTWDALAKQSPGRLRPCANGQCHLFLIDRSKAGTARWCSMAICGNRMKARRHRRKARATAGS
jgi:predicted RNA-binding Zn ribbon-like protein